MVILQKENYLIHIQIIYPLKLLMINIKIKISQNPIIGQIKQIINLLRIMKD